MWLYIINEYLNIQCLGANKAKSAFLYNTQEWLREKKSYLNKSCALIYEVAALISVPAKAA